jgi:hypothetical protein
MSKFIKGALIAFWVLASTSRLMQSRCGDSTDAWPFCYPQVMNRRHRVPPQNPTAMLDGATTMPIKRKALIAAAAFLSITVTAHANETKWPRSVDGLYCFEALNEDRVLYTRIDWNAPCAGSGNSAVIKGNTYGNGEVSNAVSLTSGEFQRQSTRYAIDASIRSAKKRLSIQSLRWNCCRIETC